MQSPSCLLAIAVWLCVAAFGQGDSDSLSAIPHGVNDAYEHHKQAAIRINDLAGRVHSVSDASAYIEAIATLFAKELPPVWTQDYIRDRTSRAEYEAVSDPAKLIPEQRIVDVWNKYVREIGAADETIVTAAEIHNMRDAEFVSAQQMWALGTQTVWTMPNIFALGPDGKVADGCRAMETVRIIHDLDGLFQNLRNARERVKKGIVASDLVKKKVHGSPHPQATFRLEARADNNPVRLAEQRYLQDHGSWAYQTLLKRLFDELFVAA